MFRRMRLERRGGCITILSAVRYSVFGLITTMVVAWGSQFISDRTNHGQMGFNSRVVLWRGFWQDEVVIVNWDSGETAEIQRRKAAEFREDSAAWAIYNGSNFSTTTAYGLPFRSVRHASHQPIQGQMPLQLYSTGLGSFTLGSVRVNFALDPIWFGLVLDSLIYGVCFFILERTFVVVRRGRWRRAGQCSGCGYSFDGLGEKRVCPECGQRASCGKRIEAQASERSRRT